jgi:hypothetical protein
LILLLAWPLSTAAQLALTRTEHEIVVTSSAPPTWKEFGTMGPEAGKYELWTEEKGLMMFYPRWANGRLESRRYVFDYEWQFVPLPDGEAQSK